MKDAYSFDVDLEGLDVSYQKMYEAYCNSFDRMGIRYKIVKADTGAMGGLLSEEFQAITGIGEDIVVGCEHCDFSSNLEITEVVDAHAEDDAEERPYELKETPDAKTIEEVAAFFDLTPKHFVKTLVYRVDGKTYAFLLRGDRELNETKVLKLLGANEMELADFAEVERVTHARVGFAGPIGIDCPLIMDREVSHMKNFITGANKSDHHYINVNVRDFEVMKIADIAQVHEGDICPKCGGKLKFEHGIEVGNLFKLGTKYAQTMGLQYLDKDNQLQPVVMGSYGIGLERCMAAIVGQHNDEHGSICPLSVAPFAESIVIISMKDEQQCEAASQLYDQLRALGAEVLLDDRDERPGVKFKDMELIGIPYRITVGRGISEGKVELVSRADGTKREVALEDAAAEVMKLIG